MVTKEKNNRRCKVLMGGVIFSNTWKGGEPKAAHTVIDILKSLNFDVKKYFAERRLVKDYAARLLMPIPPIDVDALACIEYHRIVMREKPDIVVQWFDYDLSLTYVATRKGIPTLVSVHSYWPLCPKGHCYEEGQGNCPGFRWVNGLSMRKCLMCIFRARRLGLFVKRFHTVGLAAKSKLISKIKLLDEVSGIITPSIALKKRLEGMGVDGEKIVVIPNAINCDKLKYAPWNESEKIVLYPSATCDVRKGFHYFVRLSKDVRRKDVKFVALGDITVSSLSNGVKEYITFTGYVPHTEALSWIKRAYVVVIPSVAREVQPMAALEAMALGRPILAFDVDGINELVILSGSGFTVPLDDYNALKDCLEVILEDEKLHRKMSIRARVYVEARHDIRKVARLWYEVIENTLNHKY